jgi:rare lipoprotein A (peptidoglycan hydrolase)
VRGLPSTLAIALLIAATPAAAHASTLGVPVYRNGLIAIFAVIDRGPHAPGVQLDLTHAAARKLGMSATSVVRAGY